MAAALPASPDEGRSPLFMAFLVAVALHAGGLAALRAWQPDDPTPTGEQAITIDLAPSLTEAPTLAPDETAQPLVTEAETVSPTPSEEATATLTPPDPAETVEAIETATAPAVDEASPVSPEVMDAPVPDSAAIIASPSSTESLTAEATPTIAPSDTVAPAATEASTLDPEETRPVEPPETVQAREPPKPRKAEAKPIDKPVEKPKRKPAARAATSVPSVPRAGQASSSLQDSSGSAASADPNARNRYAAQVRAAAHRRMRYPSSAEARGIGGIATVRFTLDRSGQVLRSTLLRSSGHEAIDRAALATVAPGTSLPAAPASLAGQQLSFDLPLRFGTP